MASIKTIDQYIANFSGEVKERLNAIRETIRKAAPDADETIGYGIPTYKLNGKNLVHFGGFKNHIGFYPTPDGITAFEKELSKYQGAKGSVQFPLDQPLPTALVTKIVKFRMKEVLREKKK